MDALNAIPEKHTTVAAALACAMDQLSTGVILWDIDSRTIFGNESAQEIFGECLDGGEPLEQRLLQCNAHHPDGRRFDAASFPLIRVRRLGKPVRNVEMRLPLCDGRWRCVVVDAIPVRDDARKFNAVIGIVTERAAKPDSELRQAALAEFPEQNPNPVLRVSATGSLLYGNSVAIKLLMSLGWRQGDSVPGSFSTMFPAVARSGSLEHAEVTAPDGHTFDFVVVLPKNENYFNLYGREITEERRTAAAYQQSEARFRTLADNMSQFAWMANENGWIFWYNQRWYDYTGTDLEQMQGWGWQAVHHPDHVQRVVEKFKRSLAAGDSWEDTFPLRGKDGRYRWFLSRAMPIRDEHGEMIRWFGTNTDVTEWREAEERLRASEEFNRRIIDSSRDCIKVLDLEGKLLSMNAGGQEQLRIPDITCYLNTSWIEFWNESDRPAAQRALAVAAAGGTGSFQAAYTNAQGQTTWWEAVATPILGTDGNPQRLLVVSRNVTARRFAEEQMRQARDAAEAASRAKDQFLAVISHELRTPLTPVLLSIAGMETEPGLPPQMREELTMIRQNLLLETRLIDDLLDLSRVINGKMVLHRQPLDLHALLRGVGDLLDSDFHDKQIALVWTLSAEHDRVDADSARLHQVFWNLLKNAVKFTPTGGTVTVHTFNPASNHVQVEVTDTGIGIEPSLLPGVFSAFEQGEHGINRHFGGLGLGLAISKAVVDMHGGTIRASSAGKGDGACFTVEMTTIGTAEKPASGLSGDASAPARGVIRSGCSSWKTTNQPFARCGVCSKDPATA